MSARSTDLPYRLIVTVQIEGKLDQIISGITGAGLFPVDDARKPAFMNEDVVSVEIEVNQAMIGKAVRIGIGADRLDALEHSRRPLVPVAQEGMLPPPVPSLSQCPHDKRAPTRLPAGRLWSANARLGGNAFDHGIDYRWRRIVLGLPRQKRLG